MSRDRWELCPETRHCRGHQGETVESSPISPRTWPRSALLRLERAVEISLGLRGNAQVRSAVGCRGRMLPREDTRGPDHVETHLRADVTPPWVPRGGRRFDWPSNRATVTSMGSSYPSYGVPQRRTRPAVITAT